MDKINKLILIGTAFVSVACSQLESKLSNLEHAVPFAESFSATPQMLSDKKAEKIARENSMFFKDGKPFQNPITLEYKELSARFGFYISENKKIFSSTGFNYQDFGDFIFHKKDVLLNYLSDACSVVVEKDKTIAFIKMLDEEKPSKEFIELLNHVYSKGFKEMYDLCFKKIQI